jgi:hypothetical protein
VIYPYRKFGEVAVDTAASLIAGKTLLQEVVVPVQGLITQENAKEYLRN